MRLFKRSVGSFIHEKLFIVSKNLPICSLGNRSPTGSMSAGLMTVRQPGNLVISRSSLMVKATCRGPLRPTTRTRWIRLCERAWRAWSHMSVVYSSWEGEREGGGRGEVERERRERGREGEREREREREREGGRKEGRKEGKERNREG